MTDAQDAREATEETEFRALLAHVRASRGFDYGAYKPHTLKRRIRRRMSMVGENVRTFGDYIDYLEVHPDEFAALFDTVLINVTSFFRDPEAWEYLSSTVVPRILESVGPDGTIRCWSAGCASGEEAYSLAMVLAEALGREHFCRRVKIYATDIDEQELALGRQAVYSARDLEPVSPELRDKYFSPVPSGYQFADDLRRCVIFGRHDLTQDAPISRLNLLLCRNTLMYLNAETQERILTRFRFALKEDSYLFLGRAETLLGRSALFESVEVKYRIFSPTSRTPSRQQLLDLRQPAHEEHPAAPGSAQQARLREAAFDVVGDVMVVVEAGGALVAANGRARQVLGLKSSDLGRPFRDLEAFRRPAELRDSIEQALATRGTVTLTDVEHRPTPGGAPQHLEVHVVPLDGNGQPLGVSVAMIDVTRVRRLEQELRRSNAELESAHADLQSANEDLETSNEELQSMVEELETTNEELQSTNEELETINEELHSSNSELATLNDELQRTAEANESAGFLATVLHSMNAAMVVLDRDLTVLVWNRRAEDLWGLRSEEAVGLPFLELDIGLPVEDLAAPLRAFLAEEQDRFRTTLTAITRRGKTVIVDVALTPISTKPDRWRGVVILMTVQEP